MLGHRKGARGWNPYHHKNAQATRAKILTDIHVLAIRVHSRLFVEEVFDGLVTGEDNQRLGSQHQAVDWAIFLCPFLKLKVGIPLWHLMQVSNDGKGWWSRRIAYWSPSYAEDSNEGSNKETGQCQKHDRGRGEHGHNGYK
jgi:hypothetical protein